MLQRFFRYFFFHTLGWREEVSIPHREKCILCVAPHTSNWDFLIGQLYYAAVGRRAGFLMKKDWFFWPLGPMLRKLGGIPVERSKHTSLTDQLAAIALSTERFELAVTPEGTRSHVTTWKRGFYFIALKASLPIQLFGIDYRQRRIVCTQELIPSGDVEADMQTIKNYYQQFEGLAKHPEKFSVEQ